MAETDRNGPDFNPRWNIRVFRTGLLTGKLKASFSKRAFYIFGNVSLLSRYFSVALSVTLSLLKPSLFFQALSLLSSLTGTGNPDVPKRSEKTPLHALVSVYISLFPYLIIEK